MRRFLLFSLGNLLAAALFAQTNYQINSDSTAVPFLRISPDSRAGGMGDGGVASSNDPNAIHWNLSNLAFTKRKCALSVSYTPWLRSLVPDYNLAYISFYAKPDSVSAIGASLRYFSLGRHSFTAPGSGTIGQFRPNEYAVDIGYTRKLSEHFSAGMTARFIQSNLVAPGNFTFDKILGMAFAGDISASWKGDAIGKGTKSIVPSLGLCISNVGSKMWYRDRDSAEFLPTNARLGGGLLFTIAPYHQFTLNGEANRLLVPSPTGINSLKAKLEQITLSSGIEYNYMRTYKFRFGYFHEFESHGDMRYLTTGLGIEYSVFQLDFSYLIPVGSLRNPLENTLRFTLLFNFDAFRQNRTATPRPVS
jgi:hypothetical protein